MAVTGWKRLLADASWCRGQDHFPIPAYSEFLPPPWVGIKPFDGVEATAQPPKDNWGWPISEYEQGLEIESGLFIIAREVLKEVVKLGRGERAPQIGRAKLDGNPYWPPGLTLHAGNLKHERYVVFPSVALSRTQDDKGRVRWTLFGASEQGPAKPFWKGFYYAPQKERPAAEGLRFFQRILREVHGVADAEAEDLSRAGFRILPLGAAGVPAFWAEELIPSWCEPLLWKEGSSLRRVKYLLTFRPFVHLPVAVQRAYVAGELHLLPFPGSLVFWGAQRFHELQRELPFANQIPLLHLFPRYNAVHGIRIPQTGWLDEVPDSAEPSGHGPRRSTFRRTHRFQKTTRDQDETQLFQMDDPVTVVLFSTHPNDLGIYGKPMARNAELWDANYRLVLNGPHQGSAEIVRAAQLLSFGGRFGYRFAYPPMRVGPWEVFWHRPVAAYASDNLERPHLLADAPTGYLTAYRAGKPSLERPVELWPRLLNRPLEQQAVELFAAHSQPYRHVTTYNLRGLLEFQDLLGPKPLPRSFARNLLALGKDRSLEQWLEELPRHSSDPVAAQRLVEELTQRLEPAPAEPVGALETSLTLGRTRGRSFETTYWNTIVKLAHGKFQNKDNADCVQDEPTLSVRQRHERDLEALGAYLLKCHERAIAKAGMTGKAWVAEHPFQWKCDFDFSWMGGWARNQNGQCCERNLVIRIPGQNSAEAVIVADHYDTAYMVDCYDRAYGGNGARLAAAGADDNHSATAMLLQAAPVLLELSRAGQLACDIWLVHLTGEEFPSDCLGARALCQAIVERSLKVREPNGTIHDLSAVQIRGVYDADMIAHRNDRNHNVFQIAPGEGRGSAWLALQAHRANGMWNALAQRENQRTPRKNCKAGQRVSDHQQMPPMARYPILRGEIRAEWEPRSALYNTDGQIFSDAGVPVVLFMEDYDINRSGYHDQFDTMANIDLDYGAALAAIIIETVAQAASVKAPAY